MSKSQEKKGSKKNALRDKYFYGIGRRKRATARVRIYPKKEVMRINGKDIKAFLGDNELIEKALKPLTVVGMRDDFGVSVKTQGGGKAGIAGAVSLAIARALLSYDEKLRTQLKPQGLLTRDDRKKERKKPGLHRARRAHQFSKR